MGRSATPYANKPTAAPPAAGRAGGTSATPYVTPPSTEPVPAGRAGGNSGTPYITQPVPSAASGGSIPGTEIGAAVGAGAAQATAPYVPPPTQQMFNPSTDMDFSQQPFTPYTPPEGHGLDMMKPGAAEQRYEDTKGQYDAPTQMEQFWSQNASSFQAPTQSEQFASDVNSRFGTGPQINKDGNYGAYYDRAKERAVESLDSSLAARGSYGSSVGLGQIGETISDLEADRARTEADYNLRASDAERGWVDTLSGVQNTAADDKMNRFRTGGELASTSDAMKAERLRSGMNAADTAQGRQRERGQDFITNEMAMGDRMSGLMGDYANGALTNDQALLDAILSLNIGQGAQGVANATHNATQSRDDSERNTDNMMAIYSMLAGKS